MDFIHRNLGNVGLYYTFVVGIWGLFLFLRRQPPSPSYYGAVAIAQVVFTIQAIAGVILVIMGAMPANTMHFLYGICTILTIPLAFTMTRGRTDERGSLIYGLALMFLWGLTQRAFDTGM
jgi:heme A synthase